MIVLNVYYNGEYVQDYVEEMKKTLVDNVKKEEGNIKYDFYQSVDHFDEVLLVEVWNSQETMDKHQDSDNMKKIKALKQRYQLNTRIEKYVSNDEN